uniref:ATP synthase F0 subunit 8 n=1 Tax=Gibbosula rochechouartii TaxID=2731840 RepID=A0A2K8GLZ8_9BIVA|nr:ATP synthase F0 subunit 8 [Gibbosula rochechouartii]
MPQLSPMSWVFVFSVFLMFFIWLMVMVWWGNSGSYEVYWKGVGPKVKAVCGGLKWNFGGGSMKLSKHN